MLNGQWSTPSYSPQGGDYPSLGGDRGGSMVNGQPPHTPPKGEITPPWEGTGEVQWSMVSDSYFGVFLHNTIITAAIDVTHDSSLVEDVHLGPDRVSELVSIQR